MSEEKSIALPTTSTGRPDWGEILVEYVTTDVSFLELSQREGWPTRKTIARNLKNLKSERLRSEYRERLARQEMRAHLTEADKQRKEYMNVARQMRRHGFIYANAFEKKIRDKIFNEDGTMRKDVDIAQVFKEHSVSFQSMTQLTFQGLDVEAKLAYSEEVVHERVVAAAEMVIQTAAQYMTPENFEAFIQNLPE